MPREAEKREEENGASHPHGLQRDSKGSEASAGGHSRGSEAGPRSPRRRKTGDSPRLKALKALARRVEDLEGGGVCAGG